EDGIRDVRVTGVQTCALPISRPAARAADMGNSRWTMSPRRSSAASAVAPAGRWSSRPPSSGPLAEPVRPQRPHHQNRTVEPPTIVVGGFLLGGLMESELLQHVSLSGLPEGNA